jgi:GNAT superfamily N-acetyltransferase
VLEIDDKPVGFTCYGKIPGTADSFDLYWIAVHQSQRGKGLGRQLMHRAEIAIASLMGKKIWIETSSRDIYESTRQFYLKACCEEIARLPDFYGENDDKIIYLKRV